MARVKFPSSRCLSISSQEYLGSSFGNGNVEMTAKWLRKWFQDGGAGIKIPPRWSECRCDQCSPLLMPTRLAAENLHVISEESYRTMRGELSSTSPCPPPDTSEVADECAFNDVSEKKGTAHIL